MDIEKGLMEMILENITKSGHKSAGRVKYTWDENVSWFTVCYRYGICLDSSGWVLGKKRVEIDSFSPLEPNQRLKLVERLKLQEYDEELGDGSVA